MKKIVLLSLASASILMASGYKIPESSTNAVGLCAANIAHNHENADAAYYNPAKMVFMRDQHVAELDLMYIHLNEVQYKGDVNGGGPYSLNSEAENFLVPATHFVSGKLTALGIRAGVSIVAPGGLTKRWNEEPASASAKEFALEVIEVNPTIALPIGDSLGLAVGARAVYTSGVVKAQGYNAINLLGIDLPVTGADVDMEMEGNSFDFGYNVALQYQPISSLEVGVTYRSKIDLTVEGDAKVTGEETLTSLPLEGYDGGGSVTVPLPATLSVAIAHTINDTTLEFVYERTYWSAFKNLDFNFDDGTGTITGEIDKPMPKNWKDTNTFRLGLVQEFNSFNLLAGLVKDQTAVPEETLGFELPGTDTYAASLGVRMAYSENIELACAGVYSFHQERTVQSDDIDGKFTKGNVLVLSVGLGYKF